MIPSSDKIEGQTRLIGAPRDWDQELDGPCGALSVRDEVDTQSGVNFMHSEWELEPGELARLRAGAKVLLRISGFTHPVVSVGVQPGLAEPDSLLEAARELLAWYGPFNPTRHPPEINGAWLRLEAAAGGEVPQEDTQ